VSIVAVRAVVADAAGISTLTQRAAAKKLVISVTSLVWFIDEKRQD
jgi:hypothetical protein